MVERVIVEMVVAMHLSGAALTSQIVDRLPSFRLDETFAPVEMTPREQDLPQIPEGHKVVVIRGVVDPQQIDDLEAAPGVLKVWSDGRVEPFGEQAPVKD